MRLQDSILSLLLTQQQLLLLNSFTLMGLEKSLVLFSVVVSLLLSTALSWTIAVVCGSHDCARLFFACSTEFRRGSRRWVKARCRCK